MEHIRVISQKGVLRFLDSTGRVTDYISVFQLEYPSTIEVIRNGKYFDKGWVASIGTHGSIEYFSGLDLILGQRGYPEMYQTLRLAAVKFKEGDELKISP